MPSLLPILSHPPRGDRRRGRSWIPAALPTVSSPFNLGSIVQVYPPRYRGGQVTISWQSSAPAGTWFQLYLDGVLAWAGPTTSVTMPIPSGTVRIDIGSVPAGSEWTSFASALPPAPKRRATLSWSGGRYLGADLVGFHVYGPSGLLKTITAYPGSIYTDGFGLGGFGSGGMGSSAGSYLYVSDALSSGTWNFTIKPFDAAGNEGSAQAAAVTLTVPPGTPPAFGTTQTRLQYAYSSSPHTASLSWNASAP
jgi:hypothetical protein